MINQGVARAFARVRRPGVLTFAAVSEVGVSGRRVDGGHSLNSQTTIYGTCTCKIHAKCQNTCILLESTRAFKIHLRYI